MRILLPCGAAATVSPAIRPETLNALNEMMLALVRARNAKGITMKLSDLLKTTMAGSLGDINTLMKAAEGLELLVHVKRSPIPIDQLDCAIAIVNSETNRFISEVPVTPREAPLPRDNSQGAYWEVNHNPWLD